MTATKQIVTFEQYSTYNDVTDTRYEIERGKLIPMSQPREGRCIYPKQVKKFMIINHLLCQN